MKSATICFAMLVAFFFALEVRAQENALELLWFRVNDTCPGVYTHSIVPVTPDRVTVQDIVLQGVACEPNTLVSAVGWPTTATVDVATDPYISYGFTANPLWLVVFDGANDEILVKGLARGPNGPRMAQFYYSLNGGPVTAIGSAFSVGTSAATFSRILPPILIDEGDTIELRFYAWDAITPTGRLGLNTLDVLMKSIFLPVELVFFEATTDGLDVALHWETASETSNAGFFVEMASLQANKTADEAAEAAFEQVAFVEGAGTTIETQAYRHRISGLHPGRYRFRLKQVDFDGAFDYSPAVEVAVAVPGTYLLSAAYPNPFNPETHFDLAVSRDQHITAEVFNMQGQRVDRLHQGMVRADQVYRLVFQADDRPSGVYLLRVQGEGFADTRRMVLLK